MTAREPQRQVYVLRLTALPDIDGIKALRFALKGLLRRCGLRCLSITIEKKEDGNGRRYLDQTQARNR